MFDSRQSSDYILNIDGHAVPLRVRRNARARRLILRVDDRTGGAIVTVPNRTALQEGLNLAKRKSLWIAEQLKRRSQPLPFVDGMEIPFLGHLLVVRHAPSLRRTQQRSGEIMVSGRIEHLPRRLTDWLKTQARTEITTRAHKKADQLNRHISRITMRDTRSRWGSCGAQGQLNFSWRLVLSPEFVLDYVVAHEVAHLVHHNHGADFWTLTQNLAPRMNEAKTWLKSNGQDLHRYGA